MSMKSVFTSDFCVKAEPFSSFVRRVEKKKRDTLIDLKLLTVA